MKGTKDLKTNKGITLIALVITIIVMLVLVGVTISMAVNGGLFSNAGKAVSDTKDVLNAEQKLSNGKIKVGDKWYASIEDYINKDHIEMGIELTQTEITLKKKEAADVEGTEVLTSIITASTFGMDEEPEITWETSSNAIALSATTGKTVTIEAVGTANTEATVTAKCTYEGEEYTETSKVTLEILPKSWVGYYADVDGNGSVDGVIYADLAIGGSGKWLNEYSYSYNAVKTGLKSYKVIKTFDGDFGNGKEVLQATGEGEDRFYVMALSDFTKDENNNLWEKWHFESYESFGAGPGLPTIYDRFSTSTSFGAGKKNTETWINKYPNNDLWLSIKTLNSAGWFLPSCGEWIAFLANINVNEGGGFGLSDVYWMSSEGYEGPRMGTYYVGVYSLDFVYSINRSIIDSVLERVDSYGYYSQDEACVRLSITF